MRRIIQVTQQSVDAANAQKAIVAAYQSVKPPRPTRSKFITWTDVNSWKDPSSPIYEKGRAFKLVKEILSEGPMTYQQLIERSLERYRGKATASKTSLTPAQKAAQAVKAAQATNSRSSGTPANGEKQIRFPPGHPFVSSNYLKKRIMNVLLSQNLVYTKNTRALVGSIRPELMTEEERTATGSPFSWYLNLPIEKGRKGDPIREWSIIDQWNRLISGEFPGTVYRDHQAVQKAQAAVELERAYDSGKEKRPEREVWVWEGRQPELSTRLQRLHMSRRKRRNRAPKELRRVRHRLLWENKRAQSEVEQYGPQWPKISEDDRIAILGRVRKQSLETAVDDQGQYDFEKRDLTQEGLVIRQQAKQRWIELRSAAKKIILKEKNAIKAAKEKQRLRNEQRKQKRSADDSFGRK